MRLNITDPYNAPGVLFKSISAPRPAVSGYNCKAKHPGGIKSW